MDLFQSVNSDIFWLLCSSSFCILCIFTLIYSVAHTSVLLSFHSIDNFNIEYEKILANVMMIWDWTSILKTEVQAIEWVWMYFKLCLKTLIILNQTMIKIYIYGFFFFCLNCTWLKMVRQVTALHFQWSSAMH